MADLLGNVSVAINKIWQFDALNLTHALASRLSAKSLLGTSQNNCKPNRDMLEPNHALW